MGAVSCLSDDQFLSPLSGQETFTCETHAFVHIKKNVEHGCGHRACGTIPEVLPSESSSLSNLENRAISHYLKGKRALLFGTCLCLDDSPGSQNNMKARGYYLS